MIQKFSNVTHEVVRQLRALGYPVEHFDLFFVHCLHERLDSETSKQWELKRASEKPKLMDLLDFLDHQAKAMFGSSSGSSKDNRKRVPTEKDHGESKKLRPNDSINKSSEKKSDNKPAPAGCAVCKENHPLYKCNGFLKMKLPERKRIVSEKKLCRNCLSPYHFEKDCKANVCLRCNVKHNSFATKTQKTKSCWLLP